MRVQMRKCKYAMRYHSLLYFARPSTVAEAAEYQVSAFPPLSQPFHYGIL